MAVLEEPLDRPTSAKCAAQSSSFPPCVQPNRRAQKVLPWGENKYSNLLWNGNQCKHAEHAAAPCVHMRPRSPPPEHRAGVANPRALLACPRRPRLGGPHAPGPVRPWAMRSALQPRRTSWSSAGGPPWAATAAGRRSSRRKTRARWPAAAAACCFSPPSACGPRCARQPGSAAT